MLILTQEDIVGIDGWSDQLARLVRAAWTGANGIFYFPYKPLGDAAFWSANVASDWANGRMRSWIVTHDGRIVAHAALVDRGMHWELGRLVSHGSPPGAVVALCETRMRFVRENGLRVVAECTQAHNRTQHLSARMGLRFAGIGVLERIDGISWDIVYFDNHPAPPFIPRPGILADPLGRELRYEPHHRARLREIAPTLSTNRQVELPPRHFNVLPELVEPVRRILALNP